MKAQPFKPRDLVSINKWLKLHSKAPVTLTDLPALGFVIPGVAIAFIRECEGGLGLFESMVTNPHVTSKTRHAAITALFDSAMGHNKFKMLLLFTVDGGTMSRAKNHGWHLLPDYTFMTWSRV